MNRFSEIHRIEISKISVNRDSRQRENAEPDAGLLQSIAKRGLMNPIIVTRQLELKAGERRLEAHKRLGLAEIDCRYVDELDPVELQILELEENLHRKDLEWKDQAKAVREIHDLFRGQSPEWTIGETAAAIGMAVSWVSIQLQVSGQIEKGDQKIIEAKGAAQAHSIMNRRKQRESIKALEELLAPDQQAAPQTPAASGTEGEAPLPPPPPPPEDIQQLSFLEWAPSYRGDKFNLIHCDFPYGVNFAHGEQGGKGQEGIYEDTRDVYFELLECFCHHLDNFASLSCHFVFWFSMKHYEATKQTFRNLAPSIEWVEHPLIWGKSDNAGIIGDVRRRPRHTYECALFGFRGGRHIIESVADFYSAPTDRSLHPSTKPEPVLRHFFRMLVDEQTELLDPTCGSGSALRAAESLKAKRVLGLEIDSQHVASARSALRTFRAMRQAAGRVA